MDKYKKDLNIIKHILDYCNEIEQTIVRFGATFDSFKADKIYRNAAIMCILQIGELTGRLSSEFTAAHPDISWRSIKGMRNIAAHAYGSVSFPDVWDTMTVDIPTLKAYCNTILAQR